MREGNFHLGGVSKWLNLLTECQNCVCLNVRKGSMIVCGDDFDAVLCITISESTIYYYPVI